MFFKWHSKVAWAGEKSVSLRELELSGKVAVVTGAGRGIGRAITLAYAHAGAMVSCAARTQAEIDDTVREIESFGGEGIAVRTDVTQLASVQSLYRATTQRFGGIDLLVINAGASYDRRTIEESDPEKWKATMEVNLMGAYYCAREVIPYLKQRGGGKIIAIGSGLGHRGIPERSAYASSKAGLWMLTRVLAQELWPYNIAVNELIPGPVQTSIDGKLPNDKNVVSQIESEWNKTPGDIVPMAMFLATQPVMGPTGQSFSLMRRDL